MRPSALLALAALACAPVAYVEPVGVDISTLRIENQSPAIFGYELAADTYQDASACSGRLRLAGAAALPRGVPHTVRIAADHDFTLTLRGSGGGPSRADACTLAGTFRPSAGERYVAVFRVEERKCQLLFVRQQSSARRYVQEATYRDRHEPDCL